MSSNRAWSFRLEHILAAVEKILRYTTRLSFDEFQRDERTVDAVIRNFEIIGEATRHIPEDMRLRHPSIPWSLMERMRHVLAHGYDVVDLAIVWRTIAEDLETLRKEIVKAMSEERSR